MRNFNINYLIKLIEQPKLTLELESQLLDIYHFRKTYGGFLKRVSSRAPLLNNSEEIKLRNIIKEYIIYYYNKKGRQANFINNQIHINAF